MTTMNQTQFNAGVQGLVSAGDLTQNVATGAENAFNAVWGKNNGVMNVTQLAAVPSNDEIIVTCQGNLATDQWTCEPNYPFHFGQYYGLANYEFAVANSGAGYQSEVAADSFAADIWGNNGPGYGSGVQAIGSDVYSAFYGQNLMMTCLSSTND